MLEVVSKPNEDDEYAPDDYLMLQNLLSKLKNHSRSHSTLLKITLDRDSSILYQRRLVMEYELFIGCIGGIMALFTGSDGFGWQKSGFGWVQIVQIHQKCLGFLRFLETQMQKEQEQVAKGRFQSGSDTISWV